MAKKNLCGKTRDQDKPYEIWTSVNDIMGGKWEWHVLKKNQIDDDKPGASWFCLVKTPIVPDGEMGDTYVSDIKPYAKLTYRDPSLPAEEATS
jgi:hypothetical protein